MRELEAHAPGLESMLAVRLVETNWKSEKEEPLNPLLCKGAPAVGRAPAPAIEAIEGKLTLECMLDRLPLRLRTLLIL